MKRIILPSLGALVLTASMFGAVASAEDGDEDKPWVCHPVEGKGETGNGWNLISPDKASSHIDEETGAGKHTRKDGSTDVYATFEEGVWYCPGAPVEEPVLLEADITYQSSRATCEQGQSVVIGLTNAHFEDGSTTKRFFGPSETLNFTVYADEGAEFSGGITELPGQIDPLAGPLTGPECETETDPPIDCETYYDLIESGALVRPTVELLEECGEVPEQPPVIQPEVKDPVVETKTHAKPNKTVTVEIHKSGRVTKRVTAYDYENLNQEGM